jgi:hypothetical protein
MPLPSGGELGEGKDLGPHQKTGSHTQAVIEVRHWAGAIELHSHGCPSCLLHRRIPGPHWAGATIVRLSQFVKYFFAFKSILIEMALTSQGSTGLLWEVQGMGR